jgi:hypothetical protein
MLDGPSSGQDVPAVEVDESLGGELPEPRVERNGSACEVVVKAFGGDSKCLLHDIAWVDPNGDAGVETSGNHPQEAIAVSLKQCPRSSGIAVRGKAEQLIGVGRGGRHT